MDSLSKTPCRRISNFTADEKALLAQLIKKRPVIESKLTDGKFVVKKKAEWEFLTEEFNCRAHVHKRDTLALKRAWDNMKAVTRKVRATERGNLIRTGGGPFTPPQPLQQGAIVTMVEKAAPVLLCEIKKSFDSDATILDSISQNSSCILSQDYQSDDKVSPDIRVPTPTSGTEIPLDKQQSLFVPLLQSDHARREAVMRIKFFENEKKN